MIRVKTVDFMKGSTSTIPTSSSQTPFEVEKSRCWTCFGVFTTFIYIYVLCVLYVFSVQLPPETIGSTITHFPFYDHPPKHLKVKVPQKNEDPTHDLDVEIGNIFPKPAPGSFQNVSTRCLRVFFVTFFFLASYR